MTSPARLYHGGVAGLRVGDTITPQVGQRRHVAGCPTCDARQGNATGTGTAIDPAPHRPDRVYLTPDRAYARYYASLTGRGDLYVVEPLGDLEPSAEDTLPTATAPAARIVAVYDRAVRLTDGQRRALLRRWIEADAIADGWDDLYLAMSPADRRALEERQWRTNLAVARRIAAAEVAGR